MEVKPIDPALCGQPLGFHSIEPTKGYGRVSILLFTLYWSYHKLKKRLESAAEEMADFRRCLAFMFFSFHLVIRYTWVV